MPAPLITAKNVQVAYRQGAPVIQGVDIQVAPGEAIALIGPNGAGKSTLLKSLVGLVPITAGSIDIFGETFSHQPTRAQRRRLRRQIGFVFQFHGLSRRMSALTNVVQGCLGLGYGLTAWHQATAPARLREHALDALDQVGLADKAFERADRLSGGQSQRVAIARALIRQPSLLIADEPAASLDPAAGADVMRLFRDLARNQGITLVFTSHDMSHALAYADRIVALNAGRVALDQPAAIADGDMLEKVFQ